MSVKRGFTKRNKNNDKIIVWKKQKKNISRLDGKKLDEQTRINEVKSVEEYFGISSNF